MKRLFKSLGISIAILVIAIIAVLLVNIIVEFCPVLLAIFIIALLLYTGYALSDE